MKTDLTPPVASVSSLLTVALAVLLLPVPGAAQNPPPGEPPGKPVSPELVFQEASVEITDLTPGGQVAFLTVWREQGRGGTEVTVLDEVLTDDDEDGAVTVELNRPLPELSVWAVVDVTSGLHRVQSPESFEPRRREVRLGRFVTAAGLAEFDIPRAEVLAVRPGEDAFRARLGDGGDDDQDGETNGRVALSAAELLRPVRRPPERVEPPVPERLQGGDVLLAIDPRTLEVIEIEIPGEAPAGPAGGAS